MNHHGSFHELINLLQSDSAELRLEEVRDLALTYDKAAIPYLIKATIDPNPQVRWWAVRGLGYLEATSEVDAIMACLKDEDVSVRREALNVMRQIGGDKTITALMTCLDDPDEIIRFLAALHLRPTRNPLAIAKLKERLTLETDYNLSAVINTLGCTGDESLVVDLAPFIKHTEARIRLAAIRALGDLNSPNSIPYLVESLQDYDKHASFRLYKVAARQLRMIGTPQAMQVLETWQAQTKFRRFSHSVLDTLRFIFIGSSPIDANEYSFRLIIWAVIIIIFIGLLGGLSLPEIGLGLVLGCVGLYAFFDILGGMMWVFQRIRGEQER